VRFWVRQGKANTSPSAGVNRLGPCGNRPRHFGPQAATPATRQRLGYLALHEQRTIHDGCGHRDGRLLERVRIVHARGGSGGAAGANVSPAPAQRLKPARRVGVIRWRNTLAMI
jgi:hypothetical protein